jgi:hypothetical protein
MMRRFVQKGAAVAAVLARMPLRTNFGLASFVPATKPFDAVHSAQESLSVLVDGLAFDVKHNRCILIQDNVTGLRAFGHQNVVPAGTQQHTRVGRGVSNEVRPLGLTVPVGMLLWTHSLLVGAQMIDSSTKEVKRSVTFLNAAALF